MECRHVEITQTCCLTCHLSLRSSILLKQLLVSGLSKQTSKLEYDSSPRFKMCCVFPLDFFVILKLSPLVIFCFVETIDKHTCLRLLSV